MPSPSPTGPDQPPEVTPWTISGRTGYARALKLIDALAGETPKVILIEGGDAVEREATALRLAAVVNCLSESTPCGQCASCLRIAARASLDLVYFDGSSGNILLGPRKDGDDDRPTVRDDVIPNVGRPPHSARARFFIFAEAQHLSEAAANALLKSLEEPGAGNHFILMAAQRERLLPTLVSRSWVLTLPWPDPLGLTPDDDEWIRALAGFARTGRGWFERTRKGAVDRNAAARIVTVWQKSLARALCADATDPVWTGLLGVQGLRRMDLVLAQAQDALVYQVNPGAVLDWTAVRLWRLVSGGEAA